MSNIVRTTLVLCGRYSKATVLLNGYQFDDGELTLQGGREQIEALIKFFESYQAFPNGDPRIAQINKLCADMDAEAAKQHAADDDAVTVVNVANAAEGANDGERDPEQTGGSGDSESVSGDLQSDGEGTSSEDEPPEGTGDAGDEAGTEGSVAGGNGHQDPRLPDSDDQPENRRTREAVAALDAEDDDHWTPEGDPAISAVEELMGEGGVTRDSINAVALGYTRDHALVPVPE